ncbi:MFS transporter [Trueperella bialowiezensis]|uniref:D-galactarate permease n=1 Tax=Trueperella bialowiezensis TaxID=312285 RepID=A0A448PCE2_9ACTO|nr:MFS transporter [Trueperella bialowiezensis]VEI12613.1 D-galactarate permease [Trueperella bialowiezensis]
MTRHKVALFVWLMAVAVYAVAVAGRTSFGIAGLTAIDRFTIDAATLSLFTIVQVGVYAGAQIPVGLLLDRLGPRILLSGGALILAVGQLGMAWADSLGLALAARFFIGLGDATAFTSVIRIIPSWFSPRRAPLFTQLTGIVGGLGQFISSVPFAYVLANVGWTPAFAALAVFGLGVSALAFVFVRDTPSQWTYSTIDVPDAATPADSAARQGKQEIEARPDGATRSREVPHVAGRDGVESASISQLVRDPEVWLGFWTHWLGNFPQTVFLLLWGVPFLQIHQEMSQAQASALLLVVTIAGMVFGPVIGELTARHSKRRVWLVNAIAIMLATTWTAVLLAPAPAPMWLIIALLIVLAASGPASSIGFDFARTAAPARRLGMATGLVNMGGFTAALLTAGAIGVVLDRSSGGAPLDAGDFKLALATQAIPWLFGMFMLDRCRRKARLRDAKRGIVVAPVRDVLERYAVRR